MSYYVTWLDKEAKEQNIAVFDSMEDAKDFCKENKLNTRTDVEDVKVFGMGW